VQGKVSLGMCYALPSHRITTKGIAAYYTSIYDTTPQLGAKGGSLAFACPVSLKRNHAIHSLRTLFQVLWRSI
jgi:hypothetical protein